MAEALLQAQIRVVTFISNFLKNTKDKKSPDILTIPYYEARLKLLERYYNELFARHDTLLCHSVEFKEHDYFAKNYFTCAENSYISALADINAEIDRIRASSTTQSRQLQNVNLNDSSNATQHVKVPRVSLPKFSGNQNEWESYKQRFTSLIKNKREYSDVDKLQYLLSTVEGKAAARLRGIEVTGANFKVAWDKLTKRYDNARKRLANYLETLIQLPTVYSPNVSELEILIDAVEVAVRVSRVPYRFIR